MGKELIGPGARHLYPNPTTFWGVASSFFLISVDFSREKAVDSEKYSTLTSLLSTLRVVAKKKYDFLKIKLDTVGETVYYYNYSQGAEAHKENKMKTKAIKDMTDDELLGDSLYYVEIIASKATPPMSARLEHSISAFAEYTVRKLRDLLPA